MTSSASTADDSAQASWRAALSRDEIAQLLELDDLRGWLSIAVNWGLIAAALAAVARWPGVPSVVAALFVIGARQLGLAVLMHEASHRTLLRDRRLNDAVGNWLCAYPVWADVVPYRSYHLAHHARTGLDDDPDIGLVRPFPITRRSLARKMVRDLSGVTGIKFARAARARTFGRWRADPGARRAAAGFLVTNGILLAALAAAGHAWLYLIWAGAWLTTHTLVTRVRSIAEHALTPDRDDPLGNTRTTLARWWERFLIAPNRVNYHLEHHLLMTVPHYKLPRLHALLRERGIRGCTERGYLRVLARASSKADPGAQPPDPDDRASELARVNGL